MRAFGLTVPQSVLAQADDGTGGRCCRACPMVAQGQLRGNSGHSRPGSCGPAKWQGREVPSEFDLL
jgi:hypothetical protein